MNAPFSRSPAVALRRPSVLSLVAVSTISPLAINIIVPSIPALEGAFSASYGRVQLVLSLFLAAIAVGQVVIGPLSDRLGRRPVLLGGLLIFTVASLAAPFATSIEMLILCRIVQGATGCAGIVLGRAIVRDLYERREAASMIGYVTMGLAVAPAIAPLLGGVLQDAFGWRSIFWTMAAGGALCVLVTFLDISETNHSPAETMGLGSLMREFGRLGVSPPFLAFTASSSLASAAFFAFLGGAPFVSERLLGLTPVAYGAWFMLLALGYSFGSFVSGRYSERVGIRTMVLAGSALGLAAVGTSALLFAFGFAHPLSLFLPMMIVGLSNGLTLPNAVAGAISVDPSVAGAAAGLSGAVQTAVGALFAAIAGLAVDRSGTILPLFTIMVATSFASLLAAWWIRRRRF